MTSIEYGYEAFTDERFPLPTEKQVANLEARWHIDLPSDYRRFLLEYNGGYFTEPQIVPSNPDCPIDRLNNLAGIGATHPSAELGGTGTYNPDLFDNNDPPILLPIGYTLMGNLIYLVTESEGRGVIGLKKAYTNVFFDLAEGIEGFFSLLRKPVDT
jgi:hypothetical protein